MRGVEEKRQTAMEGEDDVLMGDVAAPHALGRPSLSQAMTSLGRRSDLPSWNALFHDGFKLTFYFCAFSRLSISGNCNDIFISLCAKNKII